MMKLVILPEIPNQPSEFEMLVGSYLLGIILIGIGILSFVLTKDRFKNRNWKKGIFPTKLFFNRDNLLLAYLSLAANIIRRDNRDTAAKSMYISSFVKKEFSTCNFDYNASLKFFLKHPIQIDTVCFWLNEHVKEDRAKLQIINLLIAISKIDGALVKNELWLLRELVRQLNLDQNDLDAILAIYFKAESKSNFSSSNMTNKENALNVLGLNQNVTLKEIKKAYRKLAMIHHPDKFIQEGENELRLAQERFLKIQEAYEFLIKS